MSKHLIIGAGEVGTALYNILKNFYEVSLRDKEVLNMETCKILHIAYTYQDGFVDITKSYINDYNPELIIIHSTVPVGTTRQISPKAVHSPIRGIHPQLETGIKTFVKYFGGKKASKAASIFSKIGIQSKIFDKSETTELLKILDTTYYGWNILFCKEVKRICDEFNLDFYDVYTVSNQDYNLGYMKMDLNNVIRPVLIPLSGAIGGHCIIPNCDLLDDWLTDIIKDRNKEYLK